MSLLLFVAGQRATTPVASRQYGDDVSLRRSQRRVMVEIHEPEIAEIIREETGKPRKKSRKVKREVAASIIETAGYSGLLGSGIPAPVFDAVSAAFDSTGNDPLIYEAIALSLQYAADEADDEDVTLLLMVA